MARSAAIPLAIAGFGSLILISGIEGQSLSEVIKGEIGKGKEPLSPTGKTSTNPQESPIQAPSGEINIGGTAASPFSLPSSRPGTAGLNDWNRIRALQSKIENAYNFKKKVTKEIENGVISERTGSEKFFHRYPHYESEAREYGNLLKKLGFT